MCIHIVLSLFVNCLFVSKNSWSGISKLGNWRWYGGGAYDTYAEFNG
jgi:hypothetical protein